MSGLVGYLAGFLTNASIFTMFALGLNLQYGFTGLLNFGHVAFMGIGAYTMAILSVKGFSLWLAIAAGMAAAGVMSLFIGLPSIRLREDYLAIVTIGFAEIIRMFLNNESWLTKGPQGIFGFKDPLLALHLSPAAYRWVFMSLTIVLTLLVYLFLEYLTRSPWGRVLKAIREDEDAAIALGKNTVAYKIQAFVIGAVIAGLSGILLAFFLRYINPRNFMPIMTFVGWMIMVLGGSGNNRGAILGSIVYFSIFSATRKFESAGLGSITGPQVAALRMILIGVVLVLLMMYRPQGLLGRKEELSVDR